MNIVIIIIIIRAAATSFVFCLTSLLFWSYMM